MLGLILLLLGNVYTWYLHVPFMYLFLFGICRSVVTSIGLSCCILPFHIRHWLPLLKKHYLHCGYIVRAFATWGLIDPFVPIAPKTA